MRKAYLIAAIFIVACTENQNKENSLDKWGYKHWGQDFKNKVLCDCILAGLNDKAISNEILLKDRSFSSPINYILFDSLSREVIKPIVLQMKKDSLASTSTVSEAAAGKKIFKSCLDFYNSKKLDSITKAQESLWSKINNIDSLISKKVPAY